MNRLNITKPVAHGVTKCLLMLILTVAAGAKAAPAQQFDVGWRVNPVDSFVGVEARYGAFSPLPSINLELTVINERHDGIVTLEAGFFQAVDVTITDSAGDVVARVSGWLPVCGGLAPPANCSTSSRILLRQGETVTGIATVDAIDRSLGDGLYRMAADFRPAQSTAAGK